MKVEQQIAKYASLCERHLEIKSKLKEVESNISKLKAKLTGNERFAIQDLISERVGLLSGERKIENELNLASQELLTSLKSLGFQPDEKCSIGLAATGDLQARRFELWYSISNNEDENVKEELFFDIYEKSK